MNMNQFTQKSLEAIQSAQTIAAQHGNPQIEQIHLLDALVEQEGGFVPQLLTGMGIGKNKASGPLCVCKTLEDVAEKFKPGDVLVVPYTTNDLLPQIRQAAAIICEEASADSHTATIGLTLDKPVIIGAVHAGSRLEDGMMVSVDCARGMVQTLPQ